ncbi:T9SS type A sorting domain-containing protein, partial [Pedobacter sp. UBA4863]
LIEFRLVVKNNQTTNTGGAVFIVTKHQDAKFYFTNVRFEDNSATGIGGVIYSQLDVGASQLNITDCVFLNNSAGGGTGAGALYFAGASSNAILNISNSRFENNTVSNGGATTTYAGALRIGTGVANISNTVFKGNKAGSDKEGKGGAIYSTSGAIVNANGCTFENNTATADGGHWNVFSGVTTITNSTFTDGEATTGGAFYLNTAGTLNIASSTFNGNNSAANGGAIYQTGATSILDVKSSTFENNNATTSGGAVYCYTGNTTIANSMFKANNANSGGALYNLASTINIQKTRFYTNTANASGGALYLYAGATIPSATLISNAIFYDNYSKTATTGGAGGGAIFQTRQSTGTTSTATVVNSVFYANKSVNENPAYSFGGYADVKTNLYNNIFYSNMGNYNEATQTGSATLDIRRSATTTTAIQVYKNNLFQADITNINNRTVADAYLLNTTTPEPLFASTNPADPNFLYPTSNSFAKDKGDNGLYTTVVEDISTSKDILGNPRLVNGGTDNVDLGAIEWSTVLPVKIVSFAANLANKRTQLKWSVGTEDNVNRYEIERSQNGTDFIKVAAVQANGSSSYTATDANPQLGVNYYRLKTVDNDGTYSIYGAIQSVKVNTLNTESVKVYPNPVKDGKVNISLIGYPTGTYGYKLVSTAGLVVQQGQLNYDGNFGTINLPSSLGAGVYVIQLSLGDKIIQAKLIKQ